jgi:prepilin-type N-terminal cleavage/methylation domain-containing protein/prepilin-type processing-associated H-X9-DG protein
MKNSSILDNNRAFTLLELMVTVGIIVLLAALAFPALGAFLERGKQAAEMGAARSVMAGLHMYATDHNGAVLPGFYTPPSGFVTDREGRQITGQEAKRYPWRLAPYLNYNIDKAFLASGQKVANTTQLAYMVSLVPTLGMNTTYLGGDERKSIHPFNPRTAGRFSDQGGITLLIQARQPSKMIAFVSGFYEDSRIGGKQPGYFSVEYPDRNVDFRHGSDKAMVVFLDGHTELLDREQLKDERLWKNLPDTSFAMQ